MEIAPSDLVGIRAGWSQEGPIAVCKGGSTSSTPETGQRHDLGNVERAEKAFLPNLDVVIVAACTVLYDEA